MKIILQPAGKGAAQLHYQDTIVAPVSLSRISRFLSSDARTRIESVSEDEGVRAWGVTPGATNSNVRRWARIEQGDLALFAGQGKLFSYGEVTETLHNARVARDLWGEDENGQTWEYLYFLRPIKPLNIPYAEFNAVVGYGSKYIIRGFTILDEDRSTRLVEAFQLHATPSLRLFEKTVAAIDNLGDLDIRRAALARTEQAYLRDHLFGGKVRSECTICGRMFPVELLVAAHIKRRSDCSDAEKRDYDANVVAMCTLGCDELFERGYIVVSAGTVKRNKVKPTTPPVDKYLRDIEGRTTSAWTSLRKPYFDAHRNRTLGNRL